MQQASSKDERTLRGKAFECLSLLGLAVGKEVFANDAVEAMQAIVSMLREPEKHFEDDDPLKGFVLESLQRISKVGEGGIFAWLHRGCSDAGFRLWPVLAGSTTAYSQSAQSDGC